MDLPAGIDWSQIPSGAPPPGETPNFIDPVKNSSTNLIVISILLPITVIVVGLRAYCNFWLDRKRVYSDCEYGREVHHFKPVLNC
jgi:hypothetical protein